MTAHARKHIWIVLAEDAARYHSDVAATIARLDIETRMISMAEQEGAFIFEAMSRILARYDLHNDPGLPVVLGEVLAELTGDDQ